MKLCVLYHPASEFARSVEEYAHDFERAKGKRIELLSLETREGAATATLYDVISYPALMVIAADGKLQKLWEGPSFPLMDEVAAYLYS